ncbi:MAG: T9SS type A sorting domain-containing protein, partial [Phaeodactylibacter sp.]|nr:T9SS type A sorting domain-containing protein [Phaeodactylibacter sp.]
SKPVPACCSFFMNTLIMKMVCFSVMTFWAGLLAGQNTFSYRYHLGYPAAVFTTIVATDSLYYIVGVMADSVPPHKKGNIFLRISQTGELLSVKALSSPVKTYETWFGNMAFNPRGELAVSGYTVDSTIKSMLLVFNTEGDTLFSGQFVHPNYPEVSNALARDFKVVEDGYILVNEINNSDGTWDIDIELLKLDTLGNLQWSKTFGTTTRDDTPQSVIRTPSGYIIASIRDNTNSTHENFEFRNHIFEISDEGEILWQYLSPIDELRGLKGGVIPTSDGGLLVLTGKGIEVYVNPDTGQPRWHSYVFKLNASHQEEWGVFVRDSLEAITPNNQLRAALELGDGSGFVVAGNLVARTPENWFFSGVAAKISPTGELLWKRYYQHIIGQGPRHYIYDLAQAPDGGFVMVGEVRDTINAPRQQGWLLKVDEYGCLVPGCQLVSQVESPAQAAAPRLLLYPNPVREQLQVYYQSGGPAEAEFRIVDAQGRAWRHFHARLPEVTLIVDVAELPAGLYFLRCVQEGRAAQAQFVKQ